MLAKKIQGAGGVAPAGATVAFVAASTSDSITSIDISDPSNLSILDTHVDNTVLDVVAIVRLDGANQVLYALSRQSADNYFSSYDVSDPTNITFLDSIQPVTGWTWYSMAIDTVNQIAILHGLESGSYQMRTVDISDPTNLSLLGTVVTTYSSYTTPTFGSRPEIDSSASRAFLPTAIDGITMINTTSPASPSQVTTLVDSANLDRATVLQLNTANEEVFLTVADDAALTSVDYSVAGGTMTLNSKFVLTPTSGSSYPWGLRLDLTNDIAYISDYVGDEIFAVDISNPASMSQLGSYYSTTYFNGSYDIDIDVASSVLYGLGIDVGGFGVFTSVDISNPASMSVIDSITSATMQNPTSVQIY